MSERVELHGLSVDKDLYDLVCDEIIPGTAVNPDRFWAALAGIVADLEPRNRALLNRRDELQAQLDKWHLANREYQLGEYRGFLEEIGYIMPDGEPFKVTVANADAEITRIAGPQLVVPVDNSRFALNAANARWGSLYDALYSTDVIPETEGCKRTRRYNPVRGRRVIDYARRFLDRGHAHGRGQPRLRSEIPGEVGPAGRRHGRRQRTRPGQARTLCRLYRQPRRPGQRPAAP